MRFFNGVKFFVFILLLILFSGSSNGKNEKVLIDKNRLLDRHNFYRKAVGVTNLKWSDELANSAQEWANYLASNCEMSHSKTDLGENIYWSSAHVDEHSPVDHWASEAVFFNHKKRVFKTSHVNKMGHYTQLIWRDTKKVGGAKQFCKHGGEIWVCHYYPAGNWVGEAVY